MGWNTARALLEIGVLRHLKPRLDRPPRDATFRSVHWVTEFGASLRRARTFKQSVIQALRAFHDGTAVHYENFMTVAAATKSVQIPIPNAHAGALWRCIQLAIPA